MPDGLDLKLNEAQFAALQRDLKEFGDRGADGTIPLRQFHGYWVAVVNKAWNAVKAPGGMFRGRVWPKLKEQYTRKGDGVTIEAWGGPAAKSWPVTRNGKTFTVHRRGNKRRVKGRKRPSGQRVTQDSVINKDRDEATFRAVVLAGPWIIDLRILRIPRSLPGHARYIFSKRNPLFWKRPEDEHALWKSCLAYVDKLKRDFAAGG